MRTATILLLTLAVVIAGCVGQAPMQTQESQSQGNQTQSAATTPVYPYETSPGSISLEILSPLSGQKISGTAFGWKINVTNFRMISTGPNVPNRINEGHVHVTLDSWQPVCTYERTGSFTNVEQGQHTLRIELVDNSHKSLAPPVVKTVAFNIV
jgi:starvation-inducible outer membrane lipoprotein